MQLAPLPGKPVTAPTPVTFGVVFRPGEVPPGRTLSARFGAAELPVQLDPKRHYPDGSLKHGVVSVVVPKLESARWLEFLPTEAAQPPPAAAEAAAGKLLAGDFDVRASFTFPEGGALVSASARRMLEAAGTRAATWLKGSVAVEWLVSGPPVDAVGHADPDLLVQFQVRYYPQTGHTRVSAVVEKCSDGGSDGGLIYNVTLTQGRARPQVVFDQKNVHQPDLTRFRKVFWCGAAPPEVVVTHDARTLAAAGVIPQYDFSLRVPPAALEAQWRYWEEPRVKKGLFEHGLITPGFGTTGGRPDLGPLPGWDVLYLFTMAPRQKQLMLTLDELAAGVPIHGRDRATGRVISYESRPKLWFADSRGGRYGTEPFRLHPAPPRIRDTVTSVFTPDTAHLPCFSYLSYLVTGDYFFLEESYFWAGYVVLSENPGYSKGTLYSGQLRGRAWTLRTVALTAGIAPDADPEKESLAKRVEVTLQEYISLMTGPQAQPLGVLPVGDRSGGHWVYAPWQHDYLIMAVDCAAGAGFKDAETLRSLLLNFSLGRFTHAPDFDPQYGCGYWWTLQDDKTGYQATTWKELFERNCRGKAARIADNDYPGSYCDLALAAAAIGVRTGHPSARQVYDFLRTNARKLITQRATDPVFAFGSDPVP